MEANTGILGISDSIFGQAVIEMSVLPEWLDGRDVRQINGVMSKYKYHKGIIEYS